MLKRNDSYFPSLYKTTISEAFLDASSVTLQIQNDLQPLDEMRVLCNLTNFKCAVRILNPFAFSFLSMKLSLSIWDQKNAGICMYPDCQRRVDQMLFLPFLFKQHTLPLLIWDNKLVSSLTQLIENCVCMCLKRDSWQNIACIEIPQELLGKQWLYKKLVSIIEL